MPIYEFECSECSYIEERYTRSYRRQVSECPKCHSVSYRVISVNADQSRAWENSCRR
jgi:putative FmdB family regulatory protein